jgi:hypothetical protein
MNGTLKLKAVLLSTDGGTTWLCVHQYYLSDPQSRALLNNTLEGRKFRMNKGTENDNEQQLPRG